MFRRTLLSAGLLLCTAALSAQSPPEPTIANFVYGHDSERQKFDFWQAESDKPTPVVLLIHGGGWVNGDKKSYHRYVQQYLDAGISVAAINYRFIAQAMEQGVKPPVKACLYDAARALQTIRSQADEWNIDPDRIGAYGSSAGAATSIWLAMHDDLADPNSEDPIARESTQLTCVAVRHPQTSLDPKQLREWIPNAIYGGHAFGFAKKGRSRAEEFELLMEHRQDVLPWIKEYSPIELVSSDDPPIFMFYPNQKKPPKLGQVEKDPTHSAMYGVQLAKKLKQAGVPVVLNYPGHKSDEYPTAAGFLIENLTGE